MKRTITRLLILLMLLSLVSCTQSKADVVFGGLNQDAVEDSSEETAFDKTEETGGAEVDSIDNFTVNGTKISFLSYRNAPEAMLALDGGKVNGVYLPLCVSQYLCGNRDDLHIVEDAWSSLYQMAALPKQAKLLERIDQQLGIFLADGTLDDLKRTYLDKQTPQTDPPAVSLPYVSGEPTIKVALTGGLPPFDYVSTDGTPSGFNLALLAALGKALNLNFQPVVLDMDAKMLALSSGNVDLLFWVSATNQALSSTDTLLLSRPYFTTQNAYVTTDAYWSIVKEIAAVP